MSLTRSLSHRTTAKNSVLWTLISCTLLLTLGACSTRASATGQAAPSPTPSSVSIISVLPTLQKSLQALQQVHFAHLDVQASGTIQTSGSGSTQPATTTAYQLTVQSNIAAAQAKEQAQIQLALTPQGKATATLRANEVVAGQKLYLQGAAQQWFVLPLSAFSKQAATLSGGLPQKQNLLQFATQHLKVIDHGITTDGNQQLHHLTVTFDQQSANALAAITPQSLLKQAVSTIRMLTPVSLDLFLDNTTALPQRVECLGKVMMNADALLGLQGNAQIQGQQATLSFDSRFQLSKINQPVQTQVPTASQLPLS
jgi:hypothetical protein